MQFTYMRFFLLLTLHFCVYATMDVSNDAEKLLRPISVPQKRLTWHMPRSSNNVALTFDDGPDDFVTPKLLKIMAEKNVKATFFWWAI